MAKPLEPLVESHDVAADDHPQVAVLQELPLTVPLAAGVQRHLEEVTPFVELDCVAGTVVADLHPHRVVDGVLTELRRVHCRLDTFDAALGDVCDPLRGATAHLQSP